MPPRYYIDALKATLQEMEAPPRSLLRQYDEEDESKTKLEEKITRKLCERLTDRGYPSEPKEYSNAQSSLCRSQECDVVSMMQEGGTIWIEAKHYYTLYFTKSGKLTSSISNGRVSEQIRSLLRDCRDKLLRWRPTTNVAGILLGFEMESTPAIGRRRNPSSSEIDEFLLAEMKHYLPEWKRVLLSPAGGWCGEMEGYSGYRCVTRAMLLMPRANDRS